MGDTIELGGGARGYLAVPSSPAVAGVLVIHAWWGLLHSFVRVCDALGCEGFAALAPDLYDGRSTNMRQEAERLRDGLDRERAFATLGVGIERLRRDAGGARVGVLGFSLGSALGLGLATRRPREVDAVVCFYGTTLQPSYAALRAPVQGHFAAEDEFESAEDVAALAQEIGRHGGTTEFHNYPGTRHWFFEDERPEYDARAAGEAWARTLRFLRKHLCQDRGRARLHP